jgi:hypothetical protein
MSHTRSWWYAFTSTCSLLVGANSALQPPIWGVQGMGTVRTARLEANCVHLEAELFLGVDPNMSTFTQWSNASPRTA